MGAVEGGYLWLGVRQWTNSVLGTEKDTPMSRPFADMVEKCSCRRRTLPLLEEEATVMDKLSTYETRRPFGIDL